MSFYLLKINHCALEIRLAMTIPLILTQINLITQYDTAILLTMVPSLLFDSFTLFSWKLHVAFTAGQTVT